jgi:flagellar protein FlgJ
MTEKDRMIFVGYMYPYAKLVEEDTELNHRVQLAQLVAESGWEIPEGNMLFGVKDTDGINGNEIWVPTTEISDNPNEDYEHIIRVEPFVEDGKVYYEYTIRDYFRKYDSPYEAFLDHAEFFQRNRRYEKAWAVRQDPFAFATEVAKAGYATALNYEAYLHSMIRSVDKRLKKLGLL